METWDTEAGGLQAEGGPSAGKGVVQKGEGCPQRCVSLGRMAGEEAGGWFLSTLLGNPDFLFSAVGFRRENNVIPWTFWSELSGGCVEDGQVWEGGVLPPV